MRKGQVSLELLITIGFAITIMIPIILGVYMQVSNSSEQLSVTQAQQTAKKIGNAADTVGALGAPAKMTVQIFVPSNVENITIGTPDGKPEKEVVITIRTSGGSSDIVEPTLGKVIGNLSNFTQPGTYLITVIANDSCYIDPENSPPCVVIGPSQ